MLCHVLMLRAWPVNAALCCHAGVYVTVYLGSVFRAVLTVTLSGLIWALDIALFYSPLGHRVFGEPLDPQVPPPSGPNSTPHLDMHHPDPITSMSRPVGLCMGPWLATLLILNHVQYVGTCNGSCKWRRPLQRPDLAAQCSS